jgi:hypothetical protein
MAITAATPIALAQVLLNDSAGSNYTAASLLPLLQKAYRELQTKMQRAGLSVSEKRSSTLTVTAGTTSLGDGSGLPTDFLYPVNVWERGSTSEQWQPVNEEMWEDTDPMGPALGVYSWREDTIYFRGATTSRLVMIEYVKTAPTLTSTGTAIVIPDSDIFLASRCAAIAAVVIGENPTRGKTLNDDAEAAWQDFKGVRVKNRQGLPVRRRVNSFRR